MPTNKKAKKGAKKLRKQQARKATAASSALPVDGAAAALAASPPGPVWPEHSPSSTGKLEVTQIPLVRRDGNGDGGDGQAHDWGGFGKYLDERASQQRRGRGGANIAYWFAKYRQAFVPLDLAGPAAEAAGYQDALGRLSSEPGIRLVSAATGAFELQRSEAWRGWTEGSDVAIVCLMPGHPLHRSELERHSPHGDQLIVFPDGGKSAKSANSKDCPLVRQVCLLYSGPLVRTVRRYEPRAVLDRLAREMSDVPRKMQAFFRETRETSPRDGMTAKAMEGFMASLAETSECGVCQEDLSASRQQLVSCMYCSYEVCPACLSRMESCPQCRFRYVFRAPEAQEGRGAGLEQTDAVDGEEFGKAFDSWMSEVFARMSEKATSSDEKENVNDPENFDALFRTARKAFKAFIVHVNGDPKSQMLLKREGCWSDLMTLNAKWRTQAAEAHGAPYSPGRDFFHGLKEQHTPINGIGYEHPEAEMTRLWQAYTRATQQYRLVRQARAVIPQTRDQMLLVQVQRPGEADVAVQVFDPSVANDVAAAGKIGAQFKEMQRQGATIHPANEKAAEVAHLFGLEVELIDED